MLRRIIIGSLILLAAYIFYENFMADTLEPFFKKHKGNVDFFQRKVPAYKASE